MKLQVVVSCIFLFAGLSCSKKETIYAWRGEEESRTLTLLKDGKFILNIKAGYYNRMDTGTYQLRGDTLLINPDKINNSIDSIVVLDSLFNGQRYIEIFEEEVEVNAENVIQGSSYREIIFPSVVVNTNLLLVLSPDDAAYHKLIIPDSVNVLKFSVRIREDNTCKPLLTFFKEVPAAEQSGKSYKIYIRSRENRENYLAGFKWLIKNDTIESFFSSDSCESTEIKMVRQ